MAITINGMGEILLWEDGESELVVSSCNLKQLEDKLGRPPTPSDVQQWFELETRKALKDEVDWRLYQRYMAISRTGFTEGYGMIRLYADNRYDEPRVLLSRNIYVDHGSPPPGVPFGWDLFPLDETGQEDFDEWEAVCNVTFMHDGDIYRHVHLLEAQLRKKDDGSKEW